MSDLYCPSCSERLEFRIGADGIEQTICKNCNPELYTISLPNDTDKDVSHLARGPYGTNKELVFSPFKCPLCGSGPHKLSKLTEKTNECLDCGATYPVFD